MHTSTPLLQAHSDHAILSPIADFFARPNADDLVLADEIGQIVQEALNAVIDPVNTGRTQVGELDNVEKTYIGLKVEHFIRAFLRVPKATRDLLVDGVDVDVKNTVTGQWMIPQETYTTHGVCLLCTIEPKRRTCSLGLLVCRLDYLNAPNHDGKRGVSAAGKSNIWWLAKHSPLPEDIWANIDLIVFNSLRGKKNGSKRAADFFRAHLDLEVDRSVIRSLLDGQQDYMKRLRENGGARDLLHREGIELVRLKRSRSAPPLAEKWIARRKA